MSPFEFFPRIKEEGQFIIAKNIPELPRNRIPRLGKQKRGSKKTPFLARILFLGI
jgi:hypothetical protein